MSEDERQELVGTIAEAHAGLREIALRLRRELTMKAPALKAVIKAEREVFRLKREIERLDIEDPEPAPRARVVARGSPRGKSGRYQPPAALADDRRWAPKRSAQLVSRGGFSR